MRDYSPPYTDEDEKADKRRDRAVKRIHAVKLKDLTVGDMLTIVGIFYHRHFGIGAGDVEKLEKIGRKN